MSKKILITGGAGFIGSHLADELLKHGYQVRVLDNLLPQVHGENCARPGYLHKDVELIIGDVRDAEAVSVALKDIDVVYHFAARVGVGQSMYQIKEYTDVNNMGTACLLEVLAQNPVQKLIVASSMSIYGEGLYRNGFGEWLENVERTPEQFESRIWEPLDRLGHPLFAHPTPETKTPNLASIYALSKYDQEKLCLIFGNAYKIPTVALRFFNVYGSRQALSNPYTGVLAIFASRLMNNKSPRIFEDGLQQRDFIHVFDVAQACRLAMEKEVSNEVFNVGSGNRYSVVEIGEQLAKTLNKNIEPEITGQFRIGDIRHCFADITKSRKKLGFEPKITFEQGLAELTQWLEHQIAIDHVDHASEELKRRGLTI